MTKSKEAEAYPMDALVQAPDNPEWVPEQNQQPHVWLPESGLQASSPLKPGKARKAKAGHLWERLFVVVLAPFIIFGIPTHLIFSPAGDPGARSISAWLKSIFSPYRTVWVALSVVLACTTLMGTYAVIRWICIIFYSLIILGEVNFDELDAIYNLLQSLPVYIPTIGIWLFGNSLKQVIRGFDTAQFHLEQLIEETCAGSQVQAPKFYSSKSLLQKVFFLYFIIVAILSVTVALDFLGIQLPGSHALYASHDYWYGLYILLSYNFVLALYTMVCWGLYSQLQLFSYYLNALMTEELKPTFKILADVKFYFKKLAAEVCVVNRTFSILVSYVMVLLIGFAALNALCVILYAIPSSITVVIKIIRRYLKDFGIPFDFDVPWVHLDQDGDGHLDVEEDGMHNETMAGVAVKVVDRYGPIFVRTTVGYIFLTFSQVGLIFWVGQQAVAVNTMMRYFSIQFTDYMSSAAGSVTMDLYNEFRLVKFYIVSSITFPGKWIILRLPLMNFVPVIKRKINRTATS